MVVELQVLAVTFPETSELPLLLFRLPDDDTISHQTTTVLALDKYHCVDFLLSALCHENCFPYLLTYRQVTLHSCKVCMKPRLKIITYQVIWDSLYSHPHGPSADVTYLFTIIYATI